MQCKQLVGPYAGQIIDMPFAVYQACRAAGTVVDIDEEHNVKGLKRDADAAPEPEAKAPESKVSVEARCGIVVPLLPPEESNQVQPAGDKEVVDIPADWMDQHHNWKRARAAEISGKDVGSKAEAEEIIKDYLAKA